MTAWGELKKEGRHNGRKSVANSVQVSALNPNGTTLLSPLSSTSGSGQTTASHGLLREEALGCLIISRMCGTPQNIGFERTHASQEHHHCAGDAKGVAWRGGLARDPKVLVSSRKGSRKPRNPPFADETAVSFCTPIAEIRRQMALRIALANCCAIPQATVWAGDGCLRGTTTVVTRGKRERDLEGEGTAACRGPAGNYEVSPAPDRLQKFIPSIETVCSAA
jgi:hypothetical protein